jgi:hypothetical protein
MRNLRQALASPHSVKHVSRFGAAFVVRVVALGVNPRIPDSEILKSSDSQIF